MYVGRACSSRPGFSSAQAVATGEDGTGPNSASLVYESSRGPGKHVVRASVSADPITSLAMAAHCGVCVPQARADLHDIARKEHDVAACYSVWPQLHATVSRCEN